MLRRILLVEDHDGLRLLLGNFLSQSFDVVGARNGFEALTWLSNGLMPDAIIAGNDMPEMDAAGLLGHLRNTGLWSNVPVVVLGEVENSEQEWLRYKRLGASDFVNKPFDPLELREKLLRLTAGVPENAVQ